jgi:hypothetical protein
VDDLRVRPATPADEAEIVALMSAALGDGMPRETSFWRWKHENNPFGRSLVLVAEDADGLVGLRAMMRWTFMAGAREIQAVRPGRHRHASACPTARIVHPPHQGPCSISSPMPGSAWCSTPRTRRVGLVT